MDIYRFYIVYYIRNWIVKGINERLDFILYYYIIILSYYYLSFLFLFISIFIR